MVLLLAGQDFLVVIPLVIFSFIKVCETADIQSWPGFTWSYLQKGKDQRHQYYQLKCDLELYVAIYKSIVLFLGWSSIIAVFFVW